MIGRIFTISNLKTFWVEYNVPANRLHLFHGCYIYLHSLIHVTFELRGWGRFRPNPSGLIC